MSRSRVVFLGLLGALTLAVAGFTWAQYEGSFQRTLSVSGPVQMTVQTGSGAIVVRRGAAGVVSIRAVIRGRDQDQIHEIEQHPPIEQSGNIIEIGRLSGDLGRNIAISYEITTPAATSVKASSGSGSDTVTGLDGTVRAETGSGRVELRQIGGDASAETGSGGVAVSDVRGAVRASTGSGSIEIDRAGGAARASAGSGSIAVHGVQGEARVATGSGSIQVTEAAAGVHAETGSGTIAISGSLPALARWEAQSGSGGIVLHVPAQTVAEVDLYSGSGSIDSSLPLTVRGTINRHELHGFLHETAPGQGAFIVARTSSGSIRID